MAAIASARLQAKLRSHWITLNHSHEIEKEEVFLLFDEKWRGADVVVEMNLDRYRHSSGISEWRIYACDARPVQKEGEFRPAPLTDLARRRLGEKLGDLARTWLVTFDYEASFKRSIYDVLFRMARDPNRHYGSTPLRQAMARWTDVLDSGQSAKLSAIADAYDSYLEALSLGENG